MNEHRVRQLLDEAVYYEEHSMWLHAVQVYQQLIEEFPEQLEYRIRLGNVYLEMGNLSAAELILLQALRHDAQNPDILYSLGIACYQSADLDRALFYMRQLASRRLPKVHYSLGLIYWRMGEWQHAERHLRLTLEYQPDHSDAALALGETCLHQQKYSEAVVLMQNAAVLAPTDIALRYLLGTAQVAAELWDDAIATFHVVLTLDPFHEDARLACAGVLMKTGRFDEAEFELRTQLLNDERSVNTLIACGKLALLKANKSRAKKYFQQALEIDPDNSDALEQMRYFTPHGNSAS